jgi:hypothetical protein
MGQSIMEKALGAEWNGLGAAVKRHYDIAPGNSERRIMVGEMEIRHPRLAWPLLAMGRLFGALVSHRGRDVPVRVENWTERGSPAMHWHRTFSFQGKPPHIFRSRMEYVTGDEIIEYVRWGLGIRMRLSQRNGALIYDSIGYQWDIGPVRLRVPDWLVLGRARITEVPLGENRFAVDFQIRHFLFGEIFAYAGEFELEADSGF